MEKCGGRGKKINELDTGHKPIPIDIVNAVNKSICKISIKKNKNGTGFFMNISKTIKYLITNYHVIKPDLINEDIEIEIWNHKTMKLNLNNYNIKYFKEPEDITIIEIKNSDEIYKDINFLNYDRNYVNGYELYNNADVFSIEHPLGKSAACASGKILKIYDSEFEHDISTDNGSSGCPIILLNDNINLIQVIGIHKCSYKLENTNGGTFIGEIFKELNNDNYIICEIIIQDKDINENIRIINCYEEFIRNKIIENYNLDDLGEKFKKKYYPDGKLNKDLMNEEEIKKCEISINDKLISFNYFHKFEEKGKHKIKYKFKNNLIRIGFMFYGCKSLINIDLSNFNTQKVINMDSMFYRCKSLTNIDLSNFNTQIVNNMRSMFSGCESLINIDLSNFNTQNVNNMALMFCRCKSLTKIDLSNFKTLNVTNMFRMFYECESLTNIDLSKFNTQNVMDMSGMFYGCRSLTNIDLSNFNTQNVTNMESMFYKCKSLTNINLTYFETHKVTDMHGMFYHCELLTKIDLSKFNTQNVTNMFGMFYGCRSLTNIDLSNFNTQNVTNMDSMFYECESLNKKNVIVNDNKIIKEL